MAQRVTFGRTWWGNAWVEAMERVDYNTNRLPRGRRYARNGSVLEIRLVEGGVRALVQGTRRQPYKVRIKLKDFTPSQASKVKLLVASNPAIASSLSLGVLPERMLAMLEGAGISLFPRSWKDLEASCSCPDWANPCKHLAAVYYIVANEVDKDPFITFTLRGISAESLREAAGMAAVDEDSEDARETQAFMPCREVEAVPAMPESPDLDLSFPRLDLDGVFSLLQDSPFFWEGGDFKKVLRGAYRQVAAAAESPHIIEEFPSLREVDFYLLYDDASPAFFVALDRADSPDHRRLAEAICAPAPEASGHGRTRGRPKVVNNEVTLTTGKPRERRPGGRETETPAPATGWHAPRPSQRKLPVIRDGGLRLTSREGIKLNADQVLDFFLALPVETELTRHSPSSRALCAAGAIALSLARTSSFAPEVVPGAGGEGKGTDKGDGNGTGEFGVRYLPLVKGDTVKRAMASLESMIPANLGYRRKGQAVPAPGSAPCLVALFLDRIVGRFSPKPDGLGRDKLARAFFAGDTYRPERFEEKRTAASVANWLERLAIRGKAVSPVIRIETTTKDLFGLHLDVEDRDDPLASMLSLSEVFTAEGEIFSRPAQRVRYDLARQIAVAGEYMPQLLDILDSRGVMSAAVGPGEMADLLTRHATVLGILGIRLVLPKELAKLLTPRLTLRAAMRGSAKAATYLSLSEMLEFDWEVSLGDTIVSREEFRELARSAAGVVKYKDRYIMLTPGEAERLLRQMSKPPPAPSSMELLRWALAGEEEGIALHPDRALARWLKKMAKAEEVEVPRTLSGALRPYQERGYGWLYTNAVRGLGSCLADDMGLGKTIQAIALVLKMKERNAGKRPALVVCPTTVVGNWHKEVERFAPSLRASIYHGAERRLHTKGVDLVITTYGTLRRDLEKFKARPWGALIVDEAQNIKNPRTDQARAVKAIKAGFRVALSGTPVENHLGELWSIFDFLNPGYLGPLETFQRNYAAPIEKYRDAESIERLRRATAPFIMRRLKSDKRIISDLPDKISAEEYCYLTAEQAALYQRVVDEAMEIIEASEGMQRRGLILKLITSLKQVCDHPALFAKKGRVEARLSGKAARAVSLLENALAAGEKALVFTQYVEMGELLLKMLQAELGERALFFHGGIPRKKRDDMVREFQEGGSHAVMVVSLRAGGTGLNLTAASNVIHYDLWWNPAVEEQATDRTYRIGQSRNVYVHRLITLNTFEERIDEMMRDKRELAELTVSAGERWITELSNRELKEMFALREEA